VIKLWINNKFDQFQKSKFMDRIWKQIPFLCFVFLSIFTLKAKAQDSVTWKWEVKSIRISNNKYELQCNVNVPTAWDLYAPGQDIIGTASAVLSFPDSSIQFISPIEANSPTIAQQVSIFENKKYQLQNGKVLWKTVISVPNPIPANLLGKLAFTYGRGDAFYPQETIDVIIPLEGGVTANNSLTIKGLDIKNPLNNCGFTPTTESNGLWKIFFLGLLGGLIALLTPCVFPMIPLTVSFFTKKSDSGKGLFNAIVYGLFIFLIYISFSIPFHLLGNVNPTIYNNISTNVWLNTGFFIVFIVFAISFFGFFEISLPSGIANQANAKQGSSLIGIFFMALTLVIVSFSCTGPILGTLLAGSASSGAWPLTAGLAGFGLALGLPFGLFAMFPNWLQSLPKSGGWLGSVKIFLGFAELALALKFLSNADLVAHWGILPREIFFSIWLIIGFALFAYLIGWIKFPHDQVPSPLGFFRKSIAFLVLLFTLYLIPGLTNTKWANLSLVSGFPPPLCYSLYKNPINCDAPLKDYNEALKLSKQTGKPILIDFTGWACVNCRKMEENVWTDPTVKALMDKYILVSLYVDDKKILPSSEQFKFTTKDSIVKNIITVGDKWATFQTENFNINAQPLYVAISSDEKLLTPTIGFTPNAIEFAKWLKCGIKQ
jgi:thiol:disulfide interchange protein DsbD